MASVVFLKGIKVGGHRTFRPSVLATRLAKHGVMSIGAAGTFVVRKPLSRAKHEFRRNIPFETEVMVCRGSDIIRLISTECFDGEPSAPEVVRFVGVLAKRPPVLPALPLNIPAGGDWLVRVLAIRGRFALGLYRRTGRTIGCFGQLEKHLGGPVTVRNWNTLLNLCRILKG